MQVRPLLKSKSANGENGVRWAGAPESLEPDYLHPYQLYTKLLKSQVSDFLSVSLHAKLSLSNNAEWLELYESEFEGIEQEAGVSENEQLPESIEAQVLREEVESMCRLLAQGR